MKTSLAKEWIFGGMLLLGLAAFDVFNFATTQEALHSFLGKAKLFGIPTAAALAVAFCMVDLGGLASLFTKERGLNEPWYVWTLGIGWLIASIGNAFLTYWAVMTGMTNAPALINPMFSPRAVLNTVPILMAVTIWLIRLLLIGSLVVAGNRHEKIDRKPIAKPAARPPMKPGVPQPVASQPTMKVPAPAKPPTTMSYPSFKLDE